MAAQGLAGRHTRGALCAAGALALVALFALVPMVAPARAAHSPGCSDPP